MDSANKIIDCAKRFQTSLPKYVTEMCCVVLGCAILLSFVADKQTSSWMSSTKRLLVVYFFIHLSYFELTSVRLAVFLRFFFHFCWRLLEMSVLNQHRHLKLCNERLTVDAKKYINIRPKKIRKQIINLMLTSTDKTSLTRISLFKTFFWSHYREIDSLRIKTIKTVFC